MNIIKLIFSFLTAVFAVLGLINVLSDKIALPIAIVSLAVVMLISAKENYNKNRKTAIYFLLLSILLLIVVFLQYCFNDF